MKTGSTRLSLVHCADKLLADKTLVKKRVHEAYLAHRRERSERVHAAYLERLYRRYLGLLDRDFVVDGGVWLCCNK